MNDRAVSVLGNYEIEVIRTWKGRGTIMCESDRGLLILKEYNGRKDRIVFQDALLDRVKEQGFEEVESILKTKEGEFIVYDQDRTPYLLKTCFQGRECNLRDRRECVRAVQNLARLHKAACLKKTDMEGLLGESRCRMDWEYEKHNRELRRVRKYLKGKGQKNDFEIFLSAHYDYFFEKALGVEQEASCYLKEDKEESNPFCFICHGDYQHHNVLVLQGDAEKMAIVNFEKCIQDNPVRDLYLFMRKLLEKNSWSQELGMLLLNAYQEERTLQDRDYAQLYYRFVYPEKFWKIVNFYYNSGKAWIPGRNMEKLEKLLGQEQDKTRFLENYKSTYGSFPFG